MFIGTTDAEAETPILWPPHPFPDLKETRSLLHTESGISNQVLFPRDSSLLSCDLNHKALPFFLAGHKVIMGL